MRRGIAVTLLLGLVVSGCVPDKNAFYPETASADRILEERALARVPGRYTPVSVSVIKQWGRLQPGADTEIVGYDAWIRVKDCGGHVLVRFNRWGDHLTTGDLAECG